MFKFAKIILHDSYYLIGAYNPKTQNVEVSKYLPEELKKWVIKHELEHHEIFVQKGFSLKHIWIDYRDNLKFWSNINLVKQYKRFKRDNEMGLIQKIFEIIYFFFRIPLAFFPLLYWFARLKSWLKP